MAEVSNLHRLNHNHHQQPPPQSRRPISTTAGLQQEETGQQCFDFDSFSPPRNSANPSFLDDYTSSFSFGFDLNTETENPDSEYEDPTCFFYGGEEDVDQMNFVTDLFESREIRVTDDSIWDFDYERADLFESRETRVTEGPIWDLDTERADLSESRETRVMEDTIWDFDYEQADDSGLEFGFGPGLRPNVGLRVVGMDSESDSEEFEVNSGFINNDDVSYDSVGLSNNNYHSENNREDFEWEEVSERIHSDERENLNSVIDRIEEISVSSDISSSEGENSRFGDDEGEEVARNIEWEVLLAMNNLERNFELDISEENINQESEVSRVNLPEDYILTMEYDALFGQLVENENALKGSPPAAKSVVENLPSVVLTKDEVGENNNAVACAVCKDEVAVGEKVTRMPCCHLYHGECILPWLRIRNTCPVCRYELPTDDADYEKRRCERGGTRFTARESRA